MDLLEDVIILYNEQIVRFTSEWVDTRGIVTLIVFHLVV